MKIHRKYDSHLLKRLESQGEKQTQFQLLP